MNIRDRAIILCKNHFKENNFILTVLTEHNGIYSGVVKQYSKKSAENLLEGNLVDFFWSARLHEHLGYIKIENIKSYNSYIILDQTKLYAFNAIVALLKIAFYERENQNKMFCSLLNFIQSLKNSFSLINYIQIELEILAATGHKLQLDKCIVTKQENDLAYVSPKSGCAVKQSIGEQYKSKLLKLPKFLTGHKKISRQDIYDAFNLTLYFFQRYILHDSSKLKERVTFMQHIIKLYDYQPDLFPL